MANEGNNESGWSTIIYVIVGIIVVGGFVGKSCSEKKEEPTQQINTQQISQQIKAQRLRDLINSRQQSNNTYPTQQRTNRITYSESYSTGNSYSGNTYNTSPSTASLDNVSGNEYWKEWDDTDFQIYVELEGCESIEEAEEYDYSAIEEDDRYFVPKTISSGTYEVEVIEKVNSRMWRLNHTNIFLKFKFNPFLYKWDKGIIDTYGGKGTFYKNPD